MSRTQSLAPMEPIHLTPAREPLHRNGRLMDDRQRMDRRRVLAGLGATLVIPFATSLARAATVPRVGYLLPSSARAANQSFWDGLRDFGYAEGATIATVRRYAEGRPERYADFAAEFVHLPVDVIVADGGLAIGAAKHATATIPIVMVAADPVDLGLVASLAHPGGNVTGVSTNSPQLIGKRLELLKEMLPKLSSVAVLTNVGTPASARFVTYAERSAAALGLRLHRAAVSMAGDLDAVFAAIARAHVEALLVIEEPTVIQPNMTRIDRFAAEHRLPTISGSEVYAGSLMTYGPSYAAMFRRTAFYVDKILKGAKPADLPVEEPTTFELAVNLKVAKTLGVTIPGPLLLRADRVIE